MQVNLTYETLHQVTPEQIDRMSIDGGVIDPLLREGRRKWLDDNIRCSNVYDFAARSLDVDDTNLMADYTTFFNKLKESVRVAKLNWDRLVQICKNSGRISDDAEVVETAEMIDTKETMERIGRMIENCYDTVMMNATATLNSNEETCRVIKRALPSRWTFIEFTDENRSDFQELLRWVYRDMSQRQYRKMDGNIHIQKIVNGHPTFYWDEHKTIEKYLYETINMEANYTIWKLMVSNKDRYHEVAEHVRRAFLPRVADVMENRYMTSWNNGIYMAKQDVFYRYDDRSRWKEQAEAINASREPLREQLKSRGMTLSLEKAFPPDDTMSSLSYFDQEFDAWEDGNSLDEIVCEETDKILRDQDFSDDTMDWMYAFSGRLWYELGELDNWQCGLAVVGVAKNGKTSWQKMTRHYYPARKVVNVSDNPEATFGMSSLVDAFLCCVPELKRGFEKKFSTADLQTVLTGEETAVNRKYLTSITTKWKCNFFMCGNEFPDWASTSGSMERRLMVFLWNYTLSNADPNMVKRITNTRYAKFVRKCNVSYHEKVTKLGHVDIMGDQRHLSEQMRDFHEQMSRKVNKFLDFLLEKLEQRDYTSCEEGHVLLDKIRSDYIEYRNSKQLARVQWTDDVYTSTFNNRGMKVELCTKTWEGMSITNKFVLGLSI